MLTKNPQRLAWITILGGLVLFFALCLGTVALVRWIVFESPTPLNVTVHVGKGTVGLLEPESADEKAVRSSATLNPSERLSTDNLSQGYLAFSDPYSGDIVATVTLRGDSRATLRRANRPRFSLNDNPYEIRLENVIGGLEVWVSDGLERPIELEIETALGTTRITQKGNVLLHVTSDRLTVIARDGDATLTALSGEQVRLVSATTALVQQSTPTITVRQGPIDLLPYSTFGTAWPKEWICAHQPDPGFPNAPGGDFDYGVADGRSMIHIWRTQSGPTPAKTGCYQELGERNGDETANNDEAASPPGLDITQYAEVRLRVTMLVHHQSLSACGIAGSECPVMLRMDYLDQYGNPRVWYHGFYAEYRPNENGRRTCASCWEPHEQINKDAWYTYESGDLLNDWPEDLRPGAIQRIEFYASGHEYDVMLNEVALIASLPQPNGAP